jgi:tetratricopeptide (TPR) repeat protein
MADAYRFLGQFEKNIEFTDKAILLSPRDKALAWWYSSKAYGYFALKDYDRAADWAHRAIAANTNIAFFYTSLAPALAMSAMESQVHLPAKCTARS